MPTKIYPGFDRSGLIGIPGLLSGRANGLSISVVAISSPGTLIHTAVAGTTEFDELYLFATNVTNADATLTVEWGGTADPGDLLIKDYVVEANSLLIPIALGLRLQGAVVIGAFSDTGAAINITGYYNRVQ